MTGQHDAIKPPASTLNTKPAGRKISSRVVIPGILTFTILTGIILYGIVFSVMYSNGQNSRAYLPHSVQSPVVLTPTLMPSIPTVLPTATVTLTPTATPTPRPTATPVPTETPTPVPTMTPTPVPTENPIPVLASCPGAVIPAVPDPPLPIVRGGASAPVVALTFDDGPNPPYTDQILSILRQYGIKASFFLVGQHAETYPSLAVQEVQEGHSVGNHSFTHPELPYFSMATICWQLSTTSVDIQHITGVWPAFFRPPYGEYNVNVLNAARQMNMTVVNWSVDPKDWSLPGVNAIVNRVVSQTQNGSIILMHDGGGDRSQTVAALPLIITQLKQRGFQFVTLPQLI